MQYYIMVVKNPFVISGYVSPLYFCDREEEAKTLVRYLSNNRNTAIISTRRMGKTGLIRHCFQMPEIRSAFYCVFIDIYAVSNMREFAHVLGKAVFDSIKPKEQQFLDRFVAVIASLRAAFKIDALSGEPSFEIGLGEITEPLKTIEEIFSFLEQADKPCILAIDEFQQIAQFDEKNTEAALRTIIQACNNTNFIFAGSQQHIMSNIFQRAARPFYQSVSVMQLSQIPLAKYKEFVLFHFEQNNRKINSDVVDAVYADFEGHTWYLQIVFNELFSFTDVEATCDMEMYEMSVANIISSQAFTFQEILARLPEKQKEVLVAIAKEVKVKAINSSNFILKHHLRSASSVQSAVKYLVSKDLLTVTAGTYSVYDRFFGRWLMNYF
jgi:AAA+ ATPase superfamily predicted ATPase